MIKAIKGVKDLLPEESPRWRFIEETARRWAARYGFQEIRVPIFETTTLFARSIGATTDIVEKEMYTFADRDGTSLTLRPEGYDANIKWEETTTWNIGLDYGFARDRFYGALDFYYRQTKDLLNYIPVPAGSNLTNYILTNVGDMENKGVEFSIFTRPVDTKDWYWELGFNATYSVSEITKLTASADSSYLGNPTGDISGGVGNKVQINASADIPADTIRARS